MISCLTTRETIPELEFAAKLVQRLRLSPFGPAIPRIRREVRFKRAMKAAV
jgi:hypothetical protein